jgi:hypothetical protein
MFWLFEDQEKHFFPEPPPSLCISKDRPLLIKTNMHVYLKCVPSLSMKYAPSSSSSWGLKIFFRTYQKNFSRHITFFPKYEKNFPDIPKHFPDISYFSGNEKNFPENNINSSFQKCTLGQKRQSLRHFSRKKRALCSRKKGTCQNLGGPGPPGSYAPVWNYCNIDTFYWCTFTVYSLKKSSSLIKTVKTLKICQIHFIAVFLSLSFFH